MQGISRQGLQWKEHGQALVSNVGGGHQAHTLVSKIAKLTAEAVSPEQIDTISGYLYTWENVSFEDKPQVVDLMITVIRATSEKLQIERKSDGGHTVRPLAFMPLSSVVRRHCRI